MAKDKTKGPDAASDKWVASISEIARLTGFDRATVTRRLEGLEPVPGKKGAKDYALCDALPAIIAGQSPDLEEARKRKAFADADLAELKLARERAEVIPIDEVRDALHRLFTNMHQKIAIHYPTSISTQLYKAETARAVTNILRTGLGKIFHDLRTDPSSFLGGTRNSNSGE
jgi:hypothetical protein